MATCCQHKIDPEEFVQLYSEDKLWNDLVPDEKERISVVDLFRRHVTWRTTGDPHSAGNRENNSTGSTRLPSMVKMADIFEDALQSVRIRTLENLFTNRDVREVRFIDTARSLQNRCLLASSTSNVCIPVHEEFDFSEKAFADYLENACEIALKKYGTVNCAPSGSRFVSKKFQYDGNPESLKKE